MIHRCVPARLLPLAGAVLLVAAGCGRSSDRAAASAADSTAYPATALARLSPTFSTGTVAFVAERDGNPEVYLLDLATGVQRRITTDSIGTFPMARIGDGGDVLVISSTPDGPDHRETLFRYDAAGDSLRPLRLSSAMVRHPSVSRDASFMVFEADFQSVRDLYRYTFATDTVERITDHELGNYDPTVSPDGQRVAFASGRNEQIELYAMPVAGEGPKGRDLVQLTHFHSDDWAPRWSPDGAWIAFLSLREGPGRLFLMAPDGTGTRRLLAEADTLAENANEGEAVWSPDGAHVAFEVQPSAGGSEVWVAEVATGRRWRVAETLFSASAPTWSPDGAALVVAGIPEPEGNGDLYAVARQGGAVHRLTFDAAPDWLPVWAK